MIYLVLSLDYEIFGNGAGDVLRDVIQPTNRLLDICDRHDAKVTIMFEVGEYWAFERYDRQLGKDLGYSPCGEIERQAEDAIRRGHDVQLHLHPQWIGAEYERSTWRLRHSFWRLADLSGGLGCEEQLTSIIGALYRGKQTLDDMIKRVKANYQCICFRAGGFYAQPSQDIIRAMKRVGLRVDSSVVKGYRMTAPFKVDYSRVGIDKAAWWTTDTELTEEGTPGENVIELSVSAKMQPYWKSLKWTKLRAALKRWKVERASAGDNDANEAISSVPSGWAVLTNLLKKRASTFDFCKLSCRDMLDRVREVTEDRQLPVVAIGHSKDFINDRQFDRFLATLSGSKEVRFVSMSEYVHEMLSVPRIPGSAEIVDAGSNRLQAR